MIAETALMIDFEDALQIVKAEARPMPPETVGIGNALGRVLVAPVATRCDQPPFDNSAVDGYALCLEDVRSRTDHRKFLILGELPAGSSEECRLGPGETARVFTGGPLPVNTGGIAMQEYAVVEGECARFLTGVEPGDHIRVRGTEAMAGEEFVKPGLVTPPVLAALAAAGVSEAEVVGLPRVGILVTGSELVRPGSKLGRGQTYESNGLALAGAIRSLGLAEPIVIRVDDCLESTETALVKLLESCEVVISSGGVSVGEYDLVRRALNRLGVREYFWRVAMKPGKPVYFGKKDTAAVFGLPGNPVSALVTFALLVRPYLQGVCGRQIGHRSLRLPIAESLSKKAGRTEFVPCVFDAQEARPMVGRASHKSSCLADANGLLVLPKDIESLEAGEFANVIELRWGWES